MSFLELYRGVISGLLGALFFGAGLAVYRLVDHEDMDLITMNLFRSGLGFFFFIILAVVTRDITTILSLRPFIVLMLALSILFNVVLGDTLYFYAQTIIGVSKAFPITNLTPLFTLFLAFFLLEEPLTGRIFLGVLLVVGGIYLVAQPPKKEQLESFESGTKKIGFGLAFLSALCWTGGTLTLRLALIDIGAVHANSIRFAFAILFLGIMGSWKGTLSLRRIGTYSRRSIRIIMIATILNIMLGSLFWADSVKFAGASRGATFAATAPLFALPIAIIFLEEPVSWKTLLGTIMTIVGVWFVI